MSREKLGELIDVDAVTIWRWETGKSLPEEKNIEAVARVFKVTPAAIAGSIQLSPPPTPGIIELASLLTAATERADKAEKRSAELQSQLELVTKPIVHSDNHIHDINPDLLAAEAALREFPEIIKNVLKSAKVKRAKKAQKKETS